VSFKTNFLVLLLGLAAAPAPCAALDARYPDWPCRQLKVPTLSPAAMWAGPAIDTAGDAWERAPGLSELIAKLAARRTPLPDAEKEIADYLKGAAAEKQERAALLFAGLFDTLNAQRTQVMNGLERAHRKEKQAAETIREDTNKLRALQDAPNADQAQIEELARKIEWETRIFEDRRKTMRFACEVPTEIEQRLFALSRTIQNAL
jgi:hypothetical protein